MKHTLIIIYIFLFSTTHTPLLYGSSDIDFSTEKIHSSSQKIYNEVINNIDEPDVYIWKVTETDWIINLKKSSNYYIRVENNKMLIPTQVTFRDECTDPILDSLLGEILDESEQIDSVQIYRINLNVLLELEKFDCISGISFRPDTTFEVCFNEPGYRIWVYDNYDEDGIIIQLASKYYFSEGGHKITGVPEIFPSSDSIIVSKFISNSSEVVTLAFAPATGIIPINYSSDKYKVVIDGYDEQCILEILSTTDSLIVSPLNICKSDLYTTPHKRIPPDLIYLYFNRWNDTTLLDDVNNLINLMSTLDAEYVLLDSGDYNYFYLLKDSLNWIKRDRGNKPAMFFRYTNSVDSLKKFFKPIYDIYLEQKVVIWVKQVQDLWNNY